jgi:TP901 family phage tail tape measure protein
MDTILEEMGSRWQTLGQDQKIALAQTVAGVRQYNQLIALMDNWGTFQENLSTAQTSEGALSAQAEIYAQSWEAAQERVQAALEDVYDSLLNDEFFIELTKGFGGLIETISGLVDGLGGLKGVISLIGSIFMAQFADKIPTALSNLKRNLMVTFG